jgi:thiol-disulfide isomerase/thioredoxin
VRAQLVSARIAAAGALVALGVAATPAPVSRAGAGQPPDVAVASAVTEGRGKAAFQVVDVAAIKGLLHKSRGHVVLLHFWASWCYPCLKELPLIERFAREMKPRGLEVLSLSLDNPSRVGARVGALLQKLAPSLTPNIVQFDDADELIAAIDPGWVGAIPALFVYDHQGQLRGNLIGEASRAELDHLVAAPLKAATAPAVAPPAAAKNPH